MGFNGMVKLRLFNFSLLISLIGKGNDYIGLLDPPNFTKQHLPYFTTFAPEAGNNFIRKPLHRDRNLLFYYNALLEWFIPVMYYNNVGNICLAGIFL
jgi:hypothetical protein